jgi:hypothetical protein
MKLVVLVNDSKGDFEQMIDAVGNTQSLFIDTQHCDEEHEYNNLNSNIAYFSQSDKQIMLARFSGRESIVKNLGDERPEMIISISGDKSTSYYTENPVATFVNLISIFRD